MFMVTSQVQPDSTALTAGMQLGPKEAIAKEAIAKEAIAQTIDTLRAMNTFLNEMVQALQALQNAKPPFHQS